MGTPDESSHEVDDIRTYCIEIHKDWSFAENIVRSSCNAEILRYPLCMINRPRFELRFPHGSCSYSVDTLSADFPVLVKPWRLFSLQNHTTKLSMSICDEYEISELLTSTIFDEQLDQSVHSLDIPGVLNFRTLEKILKRFSNISKLCVVLEYERDILTEQICRTLNELPRLRSVNMVTVGGQLQFSSNAAFLHSRLRHGSIFMPLVQMEHKLAAVYAYKMFEIRPQDAAFSERWNEFFQLCPNLAHLKIGFFNWKLTIPPNLLSLKLCTAHTEFLHGLTPQMILNRLELYAVNVLRWRDMAEWCPNVRTLIVHCSTIEGLVTGLPLTVLNLSFEDLSCNVLVRDMCAMTLSHLVMDGIDKSTMIRQFNDWITNPEFLTGSLINWACPSYGGERYAAREYSAKGVVLTFRRVLARSGKSA